MKSVKSTLIELREVTQNIKHIYIELLETL